MTNKAISYAEQDLGVHSVHEEAQDLARQLDVLFVDLDKAHDNKRNLAGAIESRGFDLLIEERGKHADQSANWLEQHMRQVKHRDEGLRDLRKKLDVETGIIQGLEYDAEILRTRIKIAVARMTELGGYLNYLAATKQAATLRSHTTPAKDTQP